LLEIDRKQSDSLTAKNFFYHFDINVKKQCKHGIVKIGLIEYNEECILQKAGSTVIMMSRVSDSKERKI